MGRKQKSQIERVQEAAQYKQDAQLQLARRKLRELQDRRHRGTQEVQAARAALGEAQRRYYEAQAAVGLGTGDESAVEAARQGVDEAQARLAATCQGAVETEHLDALIRQLMARVEQLENEARGRAIERVRPIYAEAVRELAEALEAASSANERLAELAQAGASIFVYDWPRPWKELARGHDSRLDRWLEKARRYDVL